MSGEQQQEVQEASDTACPVELEQGLHIYVHDMPTIAQIAIRYAKMLRQHNKLKKQEIADVMGITRRTLYRWLRNSDTVL